MKKRYIVELGTGLDLHGMDVTKAAKKAVKDAISHSCLCGISDIFGIQDLETAMSVELKLCAPSPEQVNAAEVAEMVPFGNVVVKIEQGGMTVKGLSVPELGDGSTIVVVNAALTVYLEI